MRLLAASVLLLGISCASAHGPNRSDPPSVADRQLLAALQAPPELPALGSDTTELRFGEFFRLPVGRLGLEPTEKLLSLDGRRVRLLGYMVQQDNPAPGLLILAPYRISMAEGADGMADDLPPSVAFVHLPVPAADRLVPYSPQPLLIEGTLSVGAKEESDGRVSSVRVFVSSLTTGVTQP